MLKITVSGKTGEGKSSLIQQIKLNLQNSDYSITIDEETEELRAAHYERTGRKKVVIVEENIPADELMEVSSEVDQTRRFAKYYYKKTNVTSDELLRANSLLGFYLLGRNGWKSVYSDAEKIEAVDYLFKFFP